MKKLNSMPDYTARMPINPHDLSQSLGFTAAPGMILPVYYDMLHTGDEIHFSASMFSRLNPLVTQALGDVEMHLDHFFVPLSVMYTPSTSMFYLTDDLFSSVFDTDDFKEFPEEFPTLQFGRGTDSIFSRIYSTRASWALGSSSNYYAFDCIGKNAFRLMDLLDMGPIYMLEGHLDSHSDFWTNYPSFTPWFLLAYQAIYQLHPLYRNFDYEPKSYKYNIDRFAGRSMEDVWNADSFYRNSIFALHYIDRSKDYFNSVKVSPMGSSMSMLKDPGEVFMSVNNFLFDSDYYPVDNYSGSESIDNATNTKSDTGSDLTTQNIRQLFMVDKLLRVIGRSEKNYESQFLAHFGVKIPHDELHNITHIGHDMAILSPQAIISSANTFDGESGSALGEIGGQGSKMLTGRKYNFKAPFHGVFMTLCYFKPRLRYFAGIHKLHSLNTVMDFWQPEFDKKGMQPIFRYEALGSTLLNMSVRLGWQFAYEQFKRKYDKISVAFMQAFDSYETFSVNTYSPWFFSSRPYLHLNPSGGMYYVTNPDYIISYPSLKVGATDLNGILQVPYNPGWSDAFDNNPWLIYQTDPFISDFHMFMKKVNGMSEYGEPEL